jgi:hypothetical protein
MRLLLDTHGEARNSRNTARSAVLRELGGAGAAVQQQQAQRMSST